MTAFPPLSAGEPADGESTWASANLLWDDAYDTLYGWSASNSPADCRIDFKEYGDWDPNDPPLAQNTPGGRMSMWQWVTEIGDVVRVADFADASIWDALEMCREIAGDYVMGIDRNGDLVFKARQTSGDSVVEIRERGDQGILTDGTHAPAESIGSHLDHRAVANSITIPAWIGESKTEPPELILTPDSEADNIEVTAHFSGTSAQRVVLRCIRGGTPKTDPTAAPEVPLLFSWTRVYADLTTSLSVVARDDEGQIRVFGLYEGVDGEAFLGESKVRVGDSCYVGDGNINTIASINIATGQLTFEAGETVGGADIHPIGMTVTITPQAGHRYADSLDGICTVSGSFSLAGTYGTLTVDSTERLSAGMVLYRDTSYVQVIEIISATEIYVKKRVLGTGRGQGNWSDGDILRGAIWIEYAGYSYAISNTKLSVAIFPQTKESYGKGFFREGDRIVFTSSGLISRKVEHAIIRAVNSESIERYGQKDYKPRVENRLLSQQRARYLVSSKTEHLAWPPHATKAKGLPLLTGLAIGDLVDVSHSYLFPDAASYTVTHAVTGITWDLERGATELSLRSVQAAGRAAARTPPPSPPAPAWRRWERYGMYRR
jgi:hypothetical protein